MYLISDNIDTLTGMRLSGVLGEVVHTRDTFVESLNKVLEDNEISIVVMTEKASNLAPDVVGNIIKNRRTPLVAVIPDRHGSTKKDNNHTLIRN